jgi:2-polyprenyl-3-methyl-5-hydroxy-6-metoxy-1,4-benzoquinol methylase
VESISCLEPSPSFQKTLKKRGYSLHEKTADKKYDIVTIFNVFDICNDPEAIITDAKEALNPSGLMIISLPFPICTRSWDNRKIRKTNHLCQTRETSFE